MFLSAAAWTKSRVTMACRLSPDDIRTLAKKHDWNYMDTYVGHLGGDYGTIISFYRDGVDTAAGTPYRIKMDICHDTGMMATCKEYQERKILPCALHSWRTR